MPYLTFNFILLSLYYYSTSSLYAVSKTCSDLLTCGECIRSSLGCRWCSDMVSVSFSGALKSRSDLESEIFDGESTQTTRRCSIIMTRD